MVSSYYYFIASLPALAFGDEPPLTSAEFLRRSAEWVPAADHAVIAAIAQDAPAANESRLGARVSAWETALRGALAAARAARLGREAFLQPHGTDIATADIRSAAQELVKQDNPLAMEKRVDGLRWAFYDELGAVQLFTCAYALGYLLKLRILERWQQLDAARGAQVLDTAIHVSFQREGSDQGSEPGGRTEQE